MMTIKDNIMYMELLYDESIAIFKERLQYLSMSEYSPEDEKQISILDAKYKNNNDEINGCIYRSLDIVTQILENRKKEKEKDERFCGLSRLLQKLFAICT